MENSHVEQKNCFFFCALVFTSATRLVLRDAKSQIPDAAAIADIFKRLPNDKPSLSNCTSFKTNIQKVRAPDCPIPDEKLIKLTHAPGNFICAAKVTVPEFSRTMIVTQVPDVSVPTNIEDFWKMIFQVRNSSLKLER